MLKALRLIAPIAATTGLFTSSAYAQETVGGRLQAMVEGTVGPFLLLISLICFAGGIWLVVRGLMHLKDVAGGGHNNLAASAIFSLFAGIVLIALPEMAGVGMVSTLGQGGGLFSVSDIRAAQMDLDADTSSASSISGRIANMANVGGVKNCFESQEAVTCMASNISVNVVPMGIIALFAGVFLAGVFVFASSFFELAKTQQGAQGVPAGWWGKLIFSILMMNAPFLLMLSTQTILGSSGTIHGQGIVDPSSQLLAYTLNSTDKFKQYEQLIGYMFTILALFGAIAFVRGIFVMKSATDGKQGGSVGHGIVFMVAGVLLANSKITTCTILSTVGIQGMNAFGFCT